jgi:hypothetical protein
MPTETARVEKEYCVREIVIIVDDVSLDREG